MAYRVLLFLLISIAHFAVSAQSEVVFEVKAKAAKGETISRPKHESITLPKFDTSGLNYVLIDSAIGKGDTILFFDKRIKLEESFIQTGQGAALKQHKLKGNVLDESSAFILQHARVIMQPVYLIVFSTYNNGSLRTKEQFWYQIRILP